MEGWRFPEAFEDAANEIGPRDIALYGGKLDPNKLNFGERVLVKGVRAPSDDYPNWEEIEAWAQGIAEALRNEG